MHIDNRVIEVADSKTDVQYDPPRLFYVLGRHGCTAGP